MSTKFLNTFKSLFSSFTSMFSPSSASSAVLSDVDSIAHTVTPFPYEAPVVFTAQTRLEDAISQVDSRLQLSSTVLEIRVFMDILNDAMASSFPRITWRDEH